MRIAFEVKCVGKPGTWVEKLDTETSYRLHDLYERGDTPESLGRKLVAWFNETRHPGEHAREFVKILPIEPEDGGAE